MLTAAHLDPFFNHSITFFPSDTFPSGGVTYNLDPSTYTQLRNADNTLTDMVLIRMTADPGLPALNIPTSPTAAGTAITLAGFGANRGPAVQYLVTGSGAAAVWLPVTSGGNYSGFSYDPNAPNTSDIAKRWGTNVTSNFPGGGTTIIEHNTGNGTFTTVIGASFDQSGTPSEAIDVSGDSGGAFFSSDNPNTLLGLMLYQGQGTVPDNQPDGTAIFGNYAEAGDLSTYASQIQQIIGTPEPSALLLILAPTILLRRRK